MKNVIVYVEHRGGQTRKVTFLFSTHDQRLLEHTPRIVRLTDGRIISDTQPGTPNDRSSSLRRNSEGATHEQVLAASVS